MGGMAKQMNTTQKSSCNNEVNDTPIFFLCFAGRGHGRIQRC